MDGGIFRFVFLFSLAILGDHYFCKGASLDPFPMGTIGCLVSDVCDKREICANDLLFGSCQSVFSRALHGEPRFTLTHYEIRQLERQITALIKADFTWKDAFTQCILQNTLVGFTRSGSESTGSHQLHRLCEDALGVAGSWSDKGELEQEEDATEEAINSEIASILLRLLASAEDLDSDPRDETGMMTIESDRGVDAADQRDDRPSRLMQELLGSSQKRDEIVQVHKYFDKSKGTWKRDPYYSNYLEGKAPVSSPDQYSMYYPGYSNDDVSDDAPGFLIKSDGDRYGYQLGANEDDSVQWGNDKESQDALVDPIELNEFIKESLNDQDRLSMEPDVQTGNFNLEQIIDNLVLSEDDERTLQGLLDGSILPRDLDGAQQKRLQVFIESLIEVLETDNENIEESEADPLLDEAAAAEGPLDTESMLGPSPDFVPDQAQDDILPREMEDGEISEVETIPDEMVGLGFPEAQPSTDENGERVEGGETANDGDVQVDKKMTDDGIDEAETATQKPFNGPFDPNTMFLQLSEPVDLETARKFVRNLTDVLKLPPGLIYEIRVDPDGAITLMLNPDPEGVWDTEKLAKDAKASNDKLKAMGGITVTSSGFGQYGNRVELKQNNRYVVLTFILVGTIAGVVLAVVTIYLIKRHSRSRHKLQQLASNPDGNEASKDYQDLCRQRMQGKTSEKPEPLHAASRIGSVSEAQVRSPSSRSSTSSWSEEPAATNMDISTGHIVLSYMEDHLKNQDRLDREWEAVSGYVADPCSTRMAQDQANVRKNRFADILPYDHSRVILSSNANVANSDYINASFITDHDPRNPAYICTQGPLPHTVADFWQMIWEQGSVVIVMLTKLTESGTSLCHRYWPEEGSDLYHIYEVHLVSEHIWCDDYLVRSFYLKNLQTNETRTVTQFHFLTWPELSVPASIKATLDFRRKVNKSFRGRSCPIVVHCSDGCGRSGTYCLVDMVLNKMAKGAKEIDMAATLEHIRDQRMSMVKTKEQFQFSLAAVAEEVHAILKALPQ